MNNNSPKTVYLKDYRPSEFRIARTSLIFELTEESAVVTSQLTFERAGDKSAALVLDGQQLELLQVAIDGQPLSPDQYSVDDTSLVIPSVPDSFELSCVTRIDPANNTTLEGLYKSRTLFCTQCEAEGFRKITYYLDRPDVLSVFTTRIIADKARYPILLSNGDLQDSGELENGKHWAQWHDPFPKPAYLFALVAGDLACVDDHFTTASGRIIALKIFVESKDLDKCEHAMKSLKNAMAWDEQVYGREYDLDTFMVVAVDDFNMGAMENKGLNIFNTSCVLAKQETTTDVGFQRVESIVAHEYFHNWSGNRVTCRDWFQLSLKEGFTVFREAEFSADMGSPTVKRVEDVQMLRTLQFAEDAGPMAHPVQPSAYMEINNFYTLTVYEKGAEVVRMIHTLLGPELFRKGSDLYFDRHDGQAVTIKDFVQAMAEVSGRDFTQFMLWYSQAGTPVLDVTGRYDESLNKYHLTITQHCPSTPEARADEKQPFHIPIAMGLLGEAGALRLQLEGSDAAASADNTNHVLELTQAEQTFVFHGVQELPVPSLLRGFSAPVKLRYNYTRADLVRLMSADDDGFCRWDASQQLGVKVIQSVLEDGAGGADEHLLQGYRCLLEDQTLDPAMVALMLELPSESYLAELADSIDVEAIHNARRAVELDVATHLESHLLAVYQRTSSALTGRNEVNAETIALRSLKNKSLQYLMRLDNPSYQRLCIDQFHNGVNMTEVASALTALVHCDFSDVEQAKQDALQTFYEQWEHEPLVINQWLAIQASSPRPDTLQRIKELMSTAAYDNKNPNKIRSLIGAFVNRNPVNFHQVSGVGYEFLTNQILLLDQQNPQIAARLVTPFSTWRRYHPQRQAMMQEQLQKIAAQPQLSKDVYEIVSKILAG